MVVCFWWTLLGTVYSHVRFHSMGPFHYVRLERRIRSFSSTGVPNPFTGSRPLGPHHKKRPHLWSFVSGGRAGTRTLDPLIKSQLLYQLSYASRTATGNIIDIKSTKCKHLFIIHHIAPSCIADAILYV